MIIHRPVVVTFFILLLLRSVLMVLRIHDSTELPMRLVCIFRDHTTQFPSNVVIIISVLALLLLLLLAEWLPVVVFRLLLP